MIGFAGALYCSRCTICTGYEPDECDCYCYACGLEIDINAELIEQNRAAIKPAAEVTTK